ncbi:hypothetical protein MMC13_008011 [Lambiella insularis]|nr:hypothetical protein [Lambiella insularis]
MTVSRNNLASTTTSRPPAVSLGLSPSYISRNLLSTPNTNLPRSLSTAAAIPSQGPAASTREGIPCSSSVRLSITWSSHTSTARSSPSLASQSSSPALSADTTPSSFQSPASSPTTTPSPCPHYPSPTTTASTSPAPSTSSLPATTLTPASIPLSLLIPLIAILLLLALLAFLLLLTTPRFLPATHNIPSTSSPPQPPSPLPPSPQASFAAADLETGKAHVYELQGSVPVHWRFRDEAKELDGGPWVVEMG